MRAVANLTRGCVGIKQLEPALSSCRPSLQQFLPPRVQVQSTRPRKPCMQLAISTTSSPAPAANSASDGVGSVPGGRVFVDYHIYKGKSAVCLKPMKPTFKQLEAGAYSLQREGVIFLEFAHAIGSREYDWSNKKIFALSVAELGTILAMSSQDQAEFFHDPNKGRQGEGLVTKTLKILPMKDGLFFNIAVRETGREDKITVPVSRAEFVIMRNVMSYMLPHLMGWNAFVDPSIIDSSMLEGANAPQTNTEEGR